MATSSRDLRFNVFLNVFLYLTAAIAVDEVKWPGQPSNAPKFGQYAGYVNINATSGKNFFYAFVESPTNKSTKPLVLWLNGGPGCSSIFNGFFGEHGPWRVSGPNATDLVYNPFAWNSEANIIYLESPVGVGFSYSLTDSDYVSNDAQTAMDNYIFLQGWFKKFPQYKNRPFYIAGESYGGHYVPQLASQILLGNKLLAQPKKSPSLSSFVQINLLGLLMGNPYFKNDNGFSFVEALYNRYIITEKTFCDFKTFCKGSRFTRDCNAAYDALYTQLGSINVYDLYAPVCQYSQAGYFAATKSPSDLPKLKKTNLDKVMPILSVLNKRPANQERTAHSVSQKAKAASNAPNSVPEPFSLTNPACSDYWVYTYMNKANVQEAIHAKPNAGARATSIYTSCSYVLEYTPDNDVLPVLKKLLQSKLRVWIYSGDVDSLVPFSMTRKDVKILNQKLIVPHYPWYFYDQPAGWAQVYSSMTVLTIRAAGHLTPVSQPERSLSVFTSFLKGIRPMSKPYAL